MKTLVDIVDQFTSNMEKEKEKKIRRKKIMKEKNEKEKGKKGF